MSSPDLRGPLVSVIIPTRDRHDQLQRAVDSVRRQTYRPVEIVIADDASSTPAVAPVDASVSARVVRLDQHSGSGAARNAAIQGSSGRLIAFLDDDDVWLDDHLAGVVSAWSADPSCGVVEAGHEGWRAGRLEYTQLPSPHRTRVAIFKEPRMFPSAILVDRQMLVSVGGFDPTLRRHQDWDLFIRLSFVTCTSVVEKVSVRRDLHDDFSARDRFVLHRAMSRRIKSYLRRLTFTEQVGVRIWLARTTFVRVVHIGVAATAGERSWRRLSSASAPVRRARSARW